MVISQAVRPKPAYPSLLPFSVKIYPIIQTAPEIGFQRPGRWPPPMNKRVARWRGATAHVPSEGNQIYVHIPFCPFNCHFCPLYKVRSSREKSAASRKAYLEALIGEIELYGRVPEVAEQPINTIYFGGGTPTELAPSELSRILRALRRNFQIVSGAEITLEGVARQMMAPDYLPACIEAGFNRVSFGVQSLDRSVRRQMGRGDHPDEYPVFFESTRRAFPRLTMNLDLMVGLPMQSLTSFADDLDSVLSWRPDSVDTYYFVMFPGTRLYDSVMRGKAPAPVYGQPLLAMRRHANETLSGAGYQALTGEVFSRTDRDLFTRTSYGGGGNGLNTVLALGPSAIGLLNGTTYRNVCDLSAYLEAIANRCFPVHRGRTLNLRLARRRALLLALLRLAVPKLLCDSSTLKRQIARWNKMGLVEPKGKNFRLTKEGRLWYNHLQIDVLPFWDVLQVSRFFGSVEEQLQAYGNSPKNWPSHQKEFLRFIRESSRFGRAGHLAYRAYLYAHRFPFLGCRALGFTGPVGR